MWRHAWLWGSLLGAGLAAGLFAFYLRVRPQPFHRAEPLIVVAVLAAVMIFLVAWVVRRGLHRDLIELEASRQDAVADRDRQRRFVELLQRDTLQSDSVSLGGPLGKADSEAGASHSLIHRRVGDTTGTSARDMIARLTPQLSWLAATSTLQKWLGCTILELNGRSFLEIVHPDDVPALRVALDKALRTGEGHDIHCRIVQRSGTLRHAQLDVLTRYVNDGKPLHLRCHFIDISERVETDQELRRRTEQLSQANERLQRANHELERLKESYRDLYHNAPVMYFSLDTRGRFAALNETLLRALGYAREDLHDQAYARVLTPESREQYRAESYQKAAEIEAHWTKKDGTPIDVLIRTLPVLDNDGRFLRTRSVAQDMTERNRLAADLRAKAEELQRANDQLLRTNRELDDFTYVVSHDLKEPLRTLQAFSNFLDQDYGTKLGAEGKEFIDHLITASKRLGHLIDDLLALSRVGRVTRTMESFDLAETMATVRGDLASLIQRKNATVRIEGALPRVVGDPQRVAQLLSNLVGNGLKYNENAKPEVVVGVVPPGAARNGARGPELDRVTVFVRDNGIGIEPKYHDQIFGIFRRLHLPEQYEGTGAGLAICKKIVEAHLGRIWVESQPGLGSTFYFTLARPTTAVRPVAASGDSGILARFKGDKVG